MHTTGSPRLDRHTTPPSPTGRPRCASTCCANHSRAKQRSAGERRELRRAKKIPFCQKWISLSLSPRPKTKNTHTPRPTPPNNRTTYNASQTKQSSQTLRSDTLHFPECYRTGSILDRQACSRFSRKTKPRPPQKKIK